MARIEIEKPDTTGKVVVELVCKAENRKVGAFLTKGRIMARDMASTGFDKDRTRWPTEIDDGLQAFCAHCEQALYYRDAQGNLIPAVPDTVEFLDDPEEEKRRDQAAKVRAYKEEEERKEKMRKEKLKKEGRS